jgi:hypothetical protein
MFSGLLDPSLPGLAALGPQDLCRITGNREVRLLRLRYQPGARAVLHVAVGSEAAAREGSIWFFAGDKARKLAGRTYGAVFDGPTQALFQAFPQDHRIPALATFIEGAMAFAPGLIGGPAESMPVLMRYRPGLSATFRWTRADGVVFFVKQTPDGDVRALAEAAGQLTVALEGSDVRVPRVAGMLPDLCIIAYEAAQGTALDTVLPGAGAEAAAVAVVQVVAALRVLWGLSFVPARLMDRSELLHRAAQASTMIGLADPEAGRHAASLLNRLERQQIAVRLRPIHADMKLEHAFLFGSTTTLIDTESLSLGDPDYDLAKLEARLIMAQVTSDVAPAQIDAAVAEIRHHAGPNYKWFLACAHLQCAKFFAQRLGSQAGPLMRQVMEGR